MRTNGEIERDCQKLAVFRRGANALDEIAGALNATHDTLIAINDKLTAPVYLTPREALDAVTANPKMRIAPVIGK